MTFVEPGDPAQLAAGRAGRARRPVRRRRRRRGPGAGQGQPDRRAHRLQRRPVPAGGPAARDLRRPPRGATTTWCGSRAGRPTTSGPAGSTRPDRVRSTGGRRTSPACSGRCARPGTTCPASTSLVDSTVPLGAGLSSSAALECATAVALAALLGLDLSPDVRRSLARACMRAESEVAGAPTGGMDQMVAMLAEAGCRPARRLRRPHRPAGAGSTSASHVLLVTDTRVSHELTDGGYGSRRADCEAAADELGVPTLRQARLDDLTGITDPVRRRRAHHVVDRDRAGGRRRTGREGRATGRSRPAPAGLARLPARRLRGLVRGAGHRGGGGGRRGCAGRADDRRRASAARPWPWCPPTGWTRWRRRSTRRSPRPASPRRSTCSLPRPRPPARPDLASDGVRCGNRNKETSWPAAHRSARSRTP